MTGAFCRCTLAENEYVNTHKCSLLECESFIKQPKLVRLPCSPYLSALWSFKRWTRKPIYLITNHITRAALDLPFDLSC